MNTKSETIQDRATKAIAEVAEVYKKYRLQPHLSIRLPDKHRKIPLLARLATWLLFKYGAIIDTFYTDIAK